MGCHNIRYRLFPAAAALVLLTGCQRGPRAEFGTGPAAATVTVGVDVAPGTYTADNPDADDCYWRVSDPGGTVTDGTGRTLVLTAGQSVTTAGCGPWTRRD
jgi:hypothetical protein